MDVLPLRRRGSGYADAESSRSIDARAFGGVAEAAEPGSSKVGQANTIDDLRRKMAVLAGMPDRPSAPVADANDVLALPEVISDLLPQQGISRGAIIGYRGARSLLMAMIATVTQVGSQVGIIGMPRLNLAAAVEMGADLARIAVVPDPGIDPLEVASVLLDGMDLVVLNMRGVNAAPARCRVVGGRARQQSSSLLVVDGDWPGAHTRMDAKVLGYRHGPGAADLAAAHRGYGRVGGMRLRVSAQGRDRRNRSADIDVMAGGFGEERIRMTRVSSARVSGALDVATVPQSVAN